MTNSIGHSVPNEPDEEHPDPDVCVHGRGFDEICVDCCPEDDDGSFEGDEWS